jgi:cytochrome c-type biogenesis protein CcmF
MQPLLALLGVGMHAAWKRARLAELKRPLLIGLAVAFALALFVAGVIYARLALLTLVGLTLGMWIIYSAAREPFLRWRRKQTLSASVLGMAIAHFGVGVFTIGVTTVESYRVEKDIVLRPGSSASVGGYTFDFKSMRDVAGPNYNALEGEVEIQRNGQLIATLHPQKRVYRVQQNPMTEAGISVGWTRDLFVALGDQVGDGAWSLRLQYKPLIRYVWLGAWIMALGGLVAISDRRYRTALARDRADAQAPIAQDPA